jgi:hypothetical protein
MLDGWNRLVRMRPAPGSASFVSEPTHTTRQSWPVIAAVRRVTEDTPGLSPCVSIEGSSQLLSVRYLLGGGLDSPAGAGGFSASWPAKVARAPIGAILATATFASALILLLLDVTFTVAT